MGEFLQKLFSSDFMPHGFCYLWRPEIVWLHAISDGVITASYYMIPLALVYFVRKRRDLPFNWMFLMFGVFIFGCGTTHLIEVWTLWHGTYRLAGLVKAVTALSSVATAVALVPLLPRALALPSPEQLRAANEELEHQIGERSRMQEAVERANDLLEVRVIERTAELARANEHLRAEILERKRAESVLRKQASLLDLAHDAILVRDLEDKITYWNSGAEEIYGWERSEALGKAAQTLLFPACPEQIDFVRTIVLREGRWEGELCQRRRNGSAIVVASRWALQRDEEGNPLAMLQINTDITAQKRVAEDLQESEKRWRAVFENSAAGIAVADARGHFQATNRAYQIMSGFSEDELQNLSFADIAKEEERAENAAIFSDLLVGTRERWAGERRYVARNGMTIWSNVHLSVVRGASQEPRFLIAIAEDITNRKHAEETLAAARAQLTHMARVTTMGELAAAIAHEVNQPLAAIITNGNACLRWLAPAVPNLDEARAAAARIGSEGRRASDVLARIRALMRKGPARREFVDLNDVIRQVLDLIRPRAVRHGIELQTELVEDLPEIMGDAVQLQQVLLNLIMNAIEASMNQPKGRREIRLSSQWYPPAEAAVVVRDSGIGVDPAQLDQLFKPFYTTKSSGLGMGLSISRSIIEAHSGRLWASANQGPGATFQFAIPAQAAG